MATPSAKKEEKAPPAITTDTDDGKDRIVPETTNGTASTKKDDSNTDDFLKREGDVQIVVPSKPAGDGGSNNDVDEVDSGRMPPVAVTPVSPNNFPNFPIPGTIVGGSVVPDINFYQHKKTLAKGMMDLALFSANANQLRYVLECADRHPFFYPSMLLISLSLICQVGVGMALLWTAMYNVKNEMREANRANNFTIIAIFLVTVINVFVSAFGVANPPPPT